MTAMTLEQLKAENTDEVETTEELTPELKVVETEEVAEVTEEETLEAGEPTEEETEGEPVEAWMQTDEQTSEQHKGPSFRGLKKKLKAKIEVKDEKIAELEARIDSLTNGTVQTQQPPAKAQLPPRPKREDFDFNDDAYDEAVDDWNDKKLDIKLSSLDQERNDTQAVNSAQTSIDEAVDKHYENAAALVADGKVTEDAYRSADEAVRNAIESVMPKRGDVISDFLISHLNGAGDGGEKVWFHLGRNAEALSTLKAKMASDPSGIGAAMYLGELRRKVTASPAKRVSQAPAPGSKIKGDATQSTSVNALLKKYKAAGGDVQARLDIKRAAKEKGVDTKSWS